MSVLYDPENWLVTCNRALHDYVATMFPNYDVELNFPDTEKLVPLAKPLIHFEQDNVENPVLGFGTPGVEDYDSTAGTWRLKEAQVHLVNYDVGVWVSKDAGGATERMKATQALTDMFCRPTAKQDMQAATNGLWVVSFTGGRNELDRISDVPVWRALDMTLILRVVSRHVPDTLEVVPTDATQDQNLTIVVDQTGVPAPVE